jgi:hypothetical protein
MKSLLQSGSVLVELRSHGFIKTHTAVRAPVDRLVAQDPCHCDRTQRFRASRARNAQELDGKPCDNQPQDRRGNYQETPWRGGEGFRPLLYAEEQALNCCVCNDHVQEQVAKAAFDVLTNGHGFRSYSRPGAEANL